MLPAARRDLARAMAAEAARLDARVMPDHLQEAVALRRAFQEAAADLQRIATAARLATLFWVADPMTRAALDASQDVPALRAEDAPTPAGLIAFERPLPPWDTSEVGGLALRTPGGGFVEHTSPVEVDAIMWRTHPHHVDIDLLTRPSRLPHPLHHNEPRHLNPFAHMHCPLPTRLGQGMAALGPQGVSTDGAWTGPVSLLSAAWVMMMTPSVASTRTLDPTTSPSSTPDTTTDGTTGDGGTDGVRDARRVTIVDLRPMRHTTGTTQASGRTLTTRHLVRGHWTHQPYGPDHQLRRLQWVASYTRGPEHAPWAGGETVYAWRH